ncbi:MAG: type I secretion system permease/ATPase, partial [Rhizobiaceae bacterium]|nr:type I secretion system permease/ATPase [Rhizobiaceae bacterium]
MSAERQAQARDEFRAAFWSARHLLYVAGFFSLFVNLLMLTGPLFMLQVYDRVLSSGSVPTLIALLGLCAGLFLLMGMLDYLRGRILASAGARFQATLDGRVFEGVLRRSVAPSERSKPSMPLRDLEAVQGFLAGPAPLGFFDAPWTPIYIGVIFL